MNNPVQAASRPTQKSQSRKDSAHTGVKGRLLLSKKTPPKRTYGIYAEARSGFVHNGRKVLYTL